MNSNTTRLLFGISILALVTGLFCIHSIFDSLYLHWTDTRKPIEVESAPINRDSTIGKEIFITGKLHGQGEMLKDPMFPFEHQGILLYREVKVFYARSQTKFHIIEGERIHYRRNIRIHPSRIERESSRVSQFGDDTSDSMDATRPPIVNLIQENIPNLEISPGKILLGDYKIDPKHLASFEFDSNAEVYIPEFTNSGIHKFLQSAKAAKLKALLERLAIKGIGVSEEDAACLLLYRKSPNERIEGDTQICFKAIMEQNAGVFAIHKSDGQLIPPDYSPPENSARNPALEKPPPTLLIQFGDYANFEDYRTDSLYSGYNYFDMIVYGGVGVALLLLAMILGFGAISRYRK